MIVRSIPVTNVESRPVTVVVEPWADEYQLLPDKSLCIVFYGPDDGNIEIHVGDQRISIYGWGGSIVFVLRENIVLDERGLVETVDSVLSEHESVSREAVSNALHTHTDTVEFAEAQLESCRAWDAAGRDAAVLAATKLAHLLYENIDDKSFIWDVCQKIMQSRGVFWSLDQNQLEQIFARLSDESTTFYDELVKLIRNSRDNNNIVHVDWPTTA